MSSKSKFNLFLLVDTQNCKGWIFLDWWDIPCVNVISEWLVPVNGNDKKVLFSNGSRFLLFHFAYLQLLFHFVHRAVWRYSSSDKYGKKVVRLTHFEYCAQAILITKLDRTESVVGKCQFINMRISNIDKMSTVQCHWYGSGVFWNAIHRLLSVNTFNRISFVMPNVLYGVSSHNKQCQWCKGYRTNIDSFDTINALKHINSHSQTNRLSFK